jgi:cyclase
MPATRIIPVLLLNKGGLYKTVKFSKPAYVGDPINAVKIFNEKEADELILLDFTATKEKREIDFAKISQIAGEAFMPMAYGGGIRNIEDARRIFHCGFEKVVLNSALFNSPDLIRSITSVFGSQAVVVSIDVKKDLFGRYRVYSCSGTKNTGKDPIDWAKDVEKQGAGEIMLNSIDRDGTWNGYDEQLIRAASSAVSIPLIASGGAGSTDDFRNAVHAGASAVAAGSLFVFQKKGMGVLISFPTRLKI